jgi:hypothetical protein
VTLPVGTEVTGDETGAGDEDAGGLEGAEEGGADDEAAGACNFRVDFGFVVDTCVRFAWCTCSGVKLGFGVGFSACATRVAKKCAA